MPNTPNNPNPPEHDAEHASLELPADLIRDLQNLYGSQSSPVKIPPDIDVATLAATRQVLAAPRQRRAVIARIHKYTGWVAGVAAAVVLAAALWFSVNSSNLPGDVDGDGRVDILDAFSLARWIQSGDAAPLTYDLNADGRVDQLDVDALASRIVSLKGDRG